MAVEEFPSPELIAERARTVVDRIGAMGRPEGSVTVVAVTKAFPFAVVERALQAGLADLGENYAQELHDKDGQLSHYPNLAVQARWHFIGGLQRNKVKLLAGRVHLWHSVDRESLVDEIAKRAPGDQILIQVNTTGEASKSGCGPEQAGPLVDRARQRGLVVRGLMTVGPTSAGVDPRTSFSRLRHLAEGCEVEELSMGMSGDFELAIDEGSTMIRVGSALFGPRPRPQAPSPKPNGVGN